jgi:hypothetical protein
MLDIPTAKPKATPFKDFGATKGVSPDAFRSMAKPERQALRSEYNAGTGGVPGGTSLEAQPAPWTGPEATDWMTQYGPSAGKQSTGWKDPIAEGVARKYFGPIHATGGGGGSLYDKYLNEAKQYESGKYGGYLSPLDPLSFGSMYSFGNDMKKDYIAAGGQAYETPPQDPGMAKPGQPYITATGMATPVMNSAGVLVNPNTGQPMTGSGSQHSLDSNVINKMWR